MPKSNLHADRRADVIVGRARINGFEIKRLAKRTGITLSTMYRRLKNPNDITLGELHQIDKIIGFTDAEVLYFVRQDGRLI